MRSAISLPDCRSLAHVGGMSGLVVAAKLAGKYAKPVRRDRIPGCTYCDPQIGSVGLTEAQAKGEGFPSQSGQVSVCGELEGDDSRCA